jgi:outer membrane receptor for monomeric catechols
MNRRALLLPVALVSGAFGQTGPTPPPPAPADAPITLSPFLVSAADDTGYRATNTLDGSRLNTPLRDTPGAINVFTRDFLDDLGATDLQQVLRYDVNSEESHQDAEFSGVGNQAGNIGEGAGSTGNASAWRTRGLVGSVSLDGFRAAGRTDTYNVESVGSGRGPNAILFGTGTAGGVLSLRTKSAHPARHAGQLEFRLADNATRRGVFDLNRVLVKNTLALRAVGVLEESGSHQPHLSTKKKGATGSLQYRFSKDTSLHLSYEDTRTKGVSGRKWPHLDSITLFLQELHAGRVLWDPAQERYRTPANAAAGAAQGVANLSPRTVIVYDENLANPTLWEGATAAANRVTLSTATSVFTGTKPIVPESLIPSGRVASTGAAEYGEVEFSNLTVSIHHRLTDQLYVEFAYNNADRSSDAIIAQNPELRADLNYRLPSGALNPFFFGNGYAFAQSAYLRNIRGNDNETYRASLSYELELGRRWGRHRFALMGERNICNELFNRVREVWAGAPFGGLPEAAANQVARRRYFKLDGPLANYTPGYQADNVFAPETIGSAVVGSRSVTSTWVPPNANGFDDEVTTTSGLFVMQNRLFQQRLVTTLGLRSDRVRTWGAQSIRDAATQIWRRATAADQSVFAPRGENWFEASDLDTVRRSLGTVFHVTPNFSLIANASNGIQLPERNRTVLPTERVADPYEGEGHDYGVAFSFLDNRLSGSVRYFEARSLREGGQELVQTVFVNPNNDVMNSFATYFQRAGLTTFAPTDPIRSLNELTTTYYSGAAAYLFDQRSKGWECESISNPTRNWTVRLAYSLTERTRTNVLAEGVPWWAERLALWQRLDALYVARTGRPSIFTQPYIDQNSATQTRSVASRLADSERELAETRKQEEHGFGNRRHKASLWTRYSFSAGRLKGLAVAGGWRYQSRNIAGVDLATGAVLFGNPRSLFDLMLQYRTRGVFGRFGSALGVTYQANVANLLNDRTFFITKRTVDTVTGQPYVQRGFREDPRTASFTMRVAF